MTHSNQGARVRFDHNGEEISLDASVFACLLHEAFFEHGADMTSPVFQELVAAERAKEKAVPNG